MPKQIANRVCSLALAILMSLSICGCEGKQFTKQDVILCTQVFHAVPGARYGRPEAKRCEVIETDSQGRLLFSYSLNTTNGMFAICILQKSDEDAVYYYDNVSYFVTKEFAQYTTDQLSTLKEENDWDMPLAEEKMIRREFIDSDLDPDKGKGYKSDIALNAFRNSIAKENDISDHALYFDYSQTGQELFLISREHNISTNGGYDYEALDYHLMILNADGTYDPENYLIKIDDLSQSNEVLAAIKERNGWVG
ncbi:MAG: hypothetical protein GX602_06485 [Dehalococcoidales bacterium]|nr:hypothetical protein [Dehalococcoidales bacterium]